MSEGKRAQDRTSTDLWTISQRTDEDDEDQSDVQLKDIAQCFSTHMLAAEEQPFNRTLRMNSKTITPAPLLRKLNASLVVPVAERTSYK